MTPSRFNGPDGAPPDYFSDPGLAEALFAEAERSAKRTSSPRSNPPDVSRKEKTMPAAAPAPARRNASSAAYALERGAMPPPLLWSAQSGRPQGRASARSGFGASPGAQLRRPVPAPWAEMRAEVSAQMSEKKPLTVSEAVSRLEAALGGAIAGIWISGEVASVTVSAYGHVYFSIKDENALASCVIFRSRTGGRLFQKGDMIELQGEAEIYAPRGQLQIHVRSWRPAGAGSLYEAFLKLKARLEAEGLFAAERKRPVPKFVRRAALVTSARAAAYGDAVRTLARRTPWIEIIHIDAAVQGPDAPAELIAALAAAEAFSPDVILLVRGGGSYEDLAAFNDEGLARAIAASSVPIISGVGHETDFTIADFAADLRASTPTAAAESVGADRAAWERVLEKLAGQLSHALDRGWRHAAERFDAASMHFPGADALLSGSTACLSDAERRLLAAAAGRMRAFSDQAAAAERRWASGGELFAALTARMERAAHFLADPAACLSAPHKALTRAGTQLLGWSGALEARRANAADEAWQRISERTESILARAASELGKQEALRPDPNVLLGLLGRRLDSAAHALLLADPDRPLREGYARIELRGRGTITGASALVPGDEVTLIFADGRAEAAVKKTHLPGEPSR